MKSDKATTIGLGLVMAMSSAAHADTLQNIIDKGEVAIGVKADFAPWGMRDTNGNVVGLEIDLANDLARKLSEQAGKEITARTVVVTTSNRMEFLEQGRIDVLLATALLHKSREGFISRIQGGSWDA
ncbi:transporter substrate-binding domain-containing protein [Paracoccus pantotrophus]|uniref:transporter substrate-binding domain-containing protein n=1 Tax=Paracoccus pantotrophus TaxID=82367 RepID=UPI0035B0816F